MHPSLFWSADCFTFWQFLLGRFFFPFLAFLVRSLVLGLLLLHELLASLCNSAVGFGIWDESSPICLRWAEPIGNAFPVLSVAAALDNAAGGLSWRFCSVSPKGF